GQENGVKGIKLIERAECQEIEPHVNALKAIYVPQSGIINYKAVAEKYLELVQNKEGRAFFEHSVQNIALHKEGVTIITDKTEVNCKLVINCAGLYSDKIAQLTMPEIDLKIIPFRGEYYELRPEKQYLVKNLIYPVPNPNFPFLGVHFTRMIKGGIEAGPNAVLAFRREGYNRLDFDWAELSEILSYSGFQKIARKYWRDGLGELYRSFSKSAFVRALQHLIPEISSQDLVTGGAGVRAMACGPDGALIDDFLFLEKPGVINVCNAPSPAATASLAIGETVAFKALKHLNFN
ncbi:MAG: L-2-hydroxyglutarate oxidase, partial [Mameliella sp.]|nr:L-2-hydroxyglutarate oxidase [Phaeodactylibacter sp.]